jgi:hypothetical protein
MPDLLHEHHRTGIGDVPGSRRPQFIDVTTATTPPSRPLNCAACLQTWQSNCGWVLVANVAADFTARTCLLGFGH